MQLLQEKIDTGWKDLTCVSVIANLRSHFMNYFIMPRGTNSAFRESFFLVKGKKKALEEALDTEIKDYVNKRSVVGYRAYHTAQNFMG